MLAFESRNPAARAWEDWTPEKSRSIRVTRHGPLIEWVETEPPIGPVVVPRAHTRFERTGEHVLAVLPLVFRGEARLRADLAAAGFADMTVAGGWDGRFVDTYSPLLVVTARPRRVRGGPPGAGRDVSGRGSGGIRDALGVNCTVDAAGR